MPTDEDIVHKDVEIFCNINTFPALENSGPHRKPHVVRGLGKHYHMRFDPKLVHSTCALRWIPCDFIQCTEMLDKNWTPNIPPQQQPRYQHVTQCTYWHVVGAYNNWNIITFFTSLHQLKTFK